LKIYRYEWRWQARATPEQLWPLLANTDRTNSEGGLPALRMVVAAELPAGTQRLGFSSLGVAVAWEEPPSEWVYPRWYMIRRDYTHGPFKQWLCRVELNPQALGTQVVYSAQMQARGVLGRAIIPLQIGKRLQRMLDRLFTHYFALAEDSQPQHLSPQLRRVEVDALRLEALTCQLEQAVPGAGARRLADVVRSSDDYVAARLRPYELAHTLGVNRPQALTLFLQATRLGLLDLQWDLLCPRCRGAKETQLALADLSSTVHCDVCRIDFSADLPQQVELTFRPNPAVRKVQAETYCIGGPMRSPHVFAQQVLQPGESRALELTLAEGSYALRTFARPSSERGEVAIVVSGSRPSKRELQLTDEGWNASAIELTPIAQLTLTNATTAPHIVLLEGTQWRSDALTAAEVSTKQAFRDLFATELLRPGENISVGTLTVAFTDLRGSTALYRRIGDAPAFGRVLDHFAVIREAVDSAGGAVVKTMGDAVLAVFTSPAAALQAMQSAQRELASSDLQLKVGIHSGPCIAVTLNERLDYFGTTLNLAARLAGLSNGFDIVISEGVATDGEVANLLTGLQVEPVVAELKGLNETPPIWRIVG
jgi:class 3 adenylate cyclase